jgi:hypothetical protein
MIQPAAILKQREMTLSHIGYSAYMVALDRLDLELQAAYLSVV